MRYAGLDEAQAAIEIAGRNINNLRYGKDTTLMAESEEELKTLLMKVKGEWKTWLKTQYSENKDDGIQSSSPITSWQIDGETMRDFIFLGSQITAVMTAAMKLKDACSLEEKLWPV